MARGWCCRPRPGLEDPRSLHGVCQWHKSGVITPLSVVVTARPSQQRSRSENGDAESDGDAEGVGGGGHEVAPKQGRPVGQQQQQAGQSVGRPSRGTFTCTRWLGEMVGGRIKWLCKN